MKLFNKTVVMKTVIMGLMTLPQLGHAGRFGMTGPTKEKTIEYNVKCDGYNEDTGISFHHYVNTNIGEAYWEQNNRGALMLMGMYHDVRCQYDTCTGVANLKNMENLNLDISNCEKTGLKSKTVNMYGHLPY